MRYLGLETVDAVKLGPDYLEGSHLKLYRTKSGAWVKVLLPPVIVQRMKAFLFFLAADGFGTERGANPITRRP